MKPSHRWPRTLLLMIVARKLGNAMPTSTAAISTVIISSITVKPDCLAAGFGAQLGIAIMTSPIRRFFAG